MRYLPAARPGLAAASLGLAIAVSTATAAPPAPLRSDSTAAPAPHRGPDAAAPGPASVPPGSEWHVVGDWSTIANGDDVRAIARDGDRIWAATAGGGVVRWARDGRGLKQYLGPQDGLPCNDVRDVVRWRGEWWFGTCAGLARYDAARDRMTGLSAPLPSPSVTALATDGAGRLWVATGQWWNRTATFTGKAEPGGWTGGGVAHTADGVEWTVLDASSGLPSTNVRDVASWKGQMWVATEPSLRWRAPTTDGGGDPVPGRWEAVGGGVARRDAERWTAFDSTGVAELSDNARALAGDGRALWVATGGRGLVAYDGARWKALRDCGNPSRCIQDNYVTALSIGDDGAIWLGTSRFNGHGTGVNILDARDTPLDDTDDGWTALHAADGLPGELVHAILPDDDATVWFGTADRDTEGRPRGRALARLLDDRATVEAYRFGAAAEHGLPDNAITAVARHPLTGDLWVGTARSGVAVRSQTGKWSAYTRASTNGGLPSDSIADIAVEPGGIVWVATRSTTYDSKKARWVDGGLARFDGRSWAALTAEAAGLPSNHLSALALDGRGRLWVGTGATDAGPKELAYRGSGLAVVNTQTRQWERTFTFPTLTSDNVTDLAVHGDELWVATSYFFYVDPRPRGAQFSTGGGVSVYNLGTGAWRKVTAADGLSFAVHGRSGGPNDALIDARAIVVDADGRAWVGGQSYRDGAYDPEITPDGVVDVVGPGGIDHHRFDRAGAVVALAADHDGNLWTATTLDGVHVRAGDAWLHQMAAPGGMQSDRLTALVFDDKGNAWFGTAGDGLLTIRPPAGEPGSQSVGVQPIVRRLPFRVLMPLLSYDLPPRLIPAP